MCDNKHSAREIDDFGSLHKFKLGNNTKPTLPETYQVIFILLFTRYKDRQITLQIPAGVQLCPNLRIVIFKVSPRLPDEVHQNT